MQIEEIKVPYKEYLTYCRIVNPDWKKEAFTIASWRTGFYA
ncbi:MAG: hypothetical protein PUI76_06535 [Mollicutes bacterium]|nr:hypothetical protein [Mollicutes bacterium]